MTRSFFPLCAAALLGAGCVPVAEPVGDIDKAEQNKELVGTWCLGGDRWVIDRPQVKGNPEGLMRARVTRKGQNPDAAARGDTCWFFVATAGKHTYVNLLLGTGDRGDPDPGAEGGYAAWAKGGRGYLVGELDLGKDRFVLDGGDARAVQALMAGEKVEFANDVYRVKPGWLAAYLEKNGPDDLFTGRGVLEYHRVKE
jgi:hypothetical protein